MRSISVVSAGLLLALCVPSAGSAQDWPTARQIPHFALPIYGEPSKPLRGPDALRNTPAALAEFRLAVADAPTFVSCGVLQKRPGPPPRTEAAPFTGHDVRPALNSPGRADVALYVDSTGALTHAIEFRASQPFYRRPGGTPARAVGTIVGRDSLADAYTAANSFSVIELDFVAGLARAFNVVGGRYEPGIIGPINTVDALAPLGGPVARAKAALATCQRREQPRTGR